MCVYVRMYTRSLQFNEIINPDNSRYIAKDIIRLCGMTIYMYLV